MKKRSHAVYVLELLSAGCVFAAILVTQGHAESAQSVLQEMESRYGTSSGSPAPRGTSPSPATQPNAEVPAGQGAPPSKKSVPTVPEDRPWRVSNSCNKTETPLTVDTNVRAHLFFNGRYLANTPAVVCIRNKAIWKNDGAFLVRLSLKGYSDIVDTVIMGTDPVTKHYILQK